MASKSDTIYQLKITLDKIKPSIWRRVQIKGSSNLADMHRVIQTVFGWENSHMHQFIVGKVNYGDASFDDEVEDESAVTLTQLIPEEQSKFRYEYDFGDDWMHTIVVENIAPAEPGVQYPRCLSGKRSGPPEDSGGPFGYPHLLEITSNPEHENYAEMSEWLGEEFDPEKFDLAAVNAALQGRKSRVQRLPK
ncbi:plasmid pRiA4b ORF-3 family protein [Capsulimonas corticalis]|nr:plasmid pRiA4b ORF-3 family protein [Capsulimonas corticalis]